MNVNSKMKKKISDRDRIAPILSDTKIECLNIVEYLDCSESGNNIMIYLEPEIVNFDVIELEG